MHGVAWTTAICVGILFAVAALEARRGNDLRTQICGVIVKCVDWMHGDRLDRQLVRWTRAENNRRKIQKRLDDLEHIDELAKTFQLPVKVQYKNRFKGSTLVLQVLDQTVELVMYNTEPGKHLATKTPGVWKLSRFRWRGGLGWEAELVSTDAVHRIHGWWADTAPVVKPAMLTGDVNR